MKELESMKNKLISLLNIGDGCWEYTGGLNCYGYGQFWWKGNIRAHRASWLVFNGEIPDGLFVLHRCDNRKCCKPDHLFLGDHQDNATDRVQKNRGLVGEQHGEAKLTNKQVYEIRNRYVFRFNSRSLANEFGVSIGTIRKIGAGVTWKKV